MIDIDKYEKMSWKTPSDELEDAVENLVAEVKRLRARNIAIGVQLLGETEYRLEMEEE